METASFYLSCRGKIISIIKHDLSVAICCVLVPDNLLVSDFAIFFGKQDSCFTKDARIILAFENAKQKPSSLGKDMSRI